MNYRGSYRKLLANAKAALIACIEIYNKPSFEYRDECVVILLLNAWELIFKAMLSKNRESIFYQKKRGQPYRTLSWQDALSRAKKFLPGNIQSLPLQRNLELLGTYRDNAVHFYNADGFGVVIYALAQTSIKNFRDLTESVFGQRLEDEINWQLLPLGINPPLDIVTYISRKPDIGSKQSNAVRQFLSVLAESANEVKKAGQDTGRLLTVFSVKLESVKKIGDADVRVGVEKARGEAGPLAVVRTQDPNITHPLRSKDIIENISQLHGVRFTSYTFQAIVWKHNLKVNPQYCWKAKEGVLTRYSNDAVAYIKRLAKSDIVTALKDYRRHLRSKSKRNRSG